MKTSACDSISLTIHTSVVNVCRGVNALLPMMAREFAFSLFVTDLHSHASTAPTIQGILSFDTPAVYRRLFEFHHFEAEITLRQRIVMPSV